MGYFVSSYEILSRTLLYKHPELESEESLKMVNYIGNMYKEHLKYNPGIFADDDYVTFEMAKYIARDVQYFGDGNNYQAVDNTEAI